MEDQQLPQEETSVSFTEPVMEPDVEALSFTDKFIGILSEPTATYENVRATGPRTGNWLPPLLIIMLIFGVGMFLRFQHPEMMHLIAQQNEERVAEMVESGELSQEQADQASGQFESMSGMIKIFGPISSTIGYAFFFFVLVALYWLLLRFGFRAEISFNMTLSVYGLMMFIPIIDQLVGILLMLLTDRAFITLSPALFMEQDLNSTLYKSMMQINPFTIWSLFVLGIGFEVVARLSRAKAMVAAFSITIVMLIISQVMGWGG